jgi:hypothetical protein
LDGIALPVIAGLAVGVGTIILFITVQVPSQDAQFPEILTTSRITQEQAIVILFKEFQRNFSNFTLSNLYIYDIHDRENPKWATAEEVMQSDHQAIQLIFYHQNGTLFYINSTDNTVRGTCPPSTCARTIQFLDKLAYVIEADCNRCNEYGFDVYVIDAIEGKLIRPTSLHIKDPDSEPARGSSF